MARLGLTISLPIGLVSEFFHSSVVCEWLTSESVSSCSPYLILSLSSSFFPTYYLCFIFARLVLEKSRASHVVPQNYVKRNTEAILPQTARPNLIIIFDDIIIVFFFTFRVSLWGYVHVYQGEMKISRSGRNKNNGELVLPQLQVTPTKKNTMTTVLDDLPGLGEPRRSSADGRRSLTTNRTFTFSSGESR